MASQIAHIIYAQKYLEKHPLPNGNEDLFLAGCVFPDIRRIDEAIKRKDTHLCFKNCDLNFDGLTPFEAGWKFHLYCDMRREEILNKYKFYEIDGAGDFWHFPNKLFEDEVVYDSFRNWEKVVLFFNNIPPIETGIAVPYETLSLWYAILARYMEKKPDKKATHIFLSKQPSLAAKADQVVAALDKLRQNAKVVEILQRVKNEIV